MAAFSDSTPTVGMETPAAAGAPFAGDAVRLAADDQGAAPGKVRGRERRRGGGGVGRHGGEQFDAVLPQRGAGGGGRHAVQEGHAEQRARRGAQRLGIVRARRALEEQDAGGAEGLGGAHDGAGVARILKAVEHHHQGLAAEQLFELPFGRLHQRHHALAGFGGGDSGEKRVRQHHHFRAGQTPPMSLHRGALLSAASTALTSQGLRSASSSRWNVSATHQPSAVSAPRATARRTSFSSGLAALVIVSGVNICLQ